MLGKIADRKDRLLHMEKKLATLDRTRLGKEVKSLLVLSDTGVLCFAFCASHLALRTGRGRRREWGRLVCALL